MLHIAGGQALDRWPSHASLVEPLKKYSQHNMPSLNFEDLDGPPVELDLGPQISVAMALHRGDSAGLWREAPQHNYEQFVDEVRDAVNFVAVDGPKTRHGKVMVHGGLLFIPILVPAAMAHIVNANEHPETMNALRYAKAWLQPWFETPVQIEVMTSIMGYSYICNWQPAVMHRYLMDMVNRTLTPVKECPHPLELQFPEGAGQLAFIVAAVKRINFRPALPEPVLTADHLLKGRIGGMLEVAGGGRQMHRPIVMQPDFACDAILRGVLAWVDRIHEADEIVQWDVVPQDSDLAYLRLETDESGMVYTLPIRLYQLGTAGMSRLLKHVDALSKSARGGPTFVAEIIYN
jgi:hypothetical protein